MNSKKSIILLITLFFISAISILILQNLKDTSTYLDNIEYENSLVQLQVTIENINEEVPKYLEKNKKNIDDLLEEKQVIPFSFGNIDILLNVQEYMGTEFDINNLTTQDTMSEDFTNNVNFKYDFLQIIDEHKKDNNYTTHSQIKQTLNEYIKLTKDKDILNIDDKFGYIIDSNTTQFIICNYTVKVNEQSSDVTFIFDLETSKTVDFKCTINE